MSMTIDNQQNRTLWSFRECAVCGSKAIGVNFGAPTCAPCKGIQYLIKINENIIFNFLAFFRRNARRKEVKNFE